MSLELVKEPVKVNRIISVDSAQTVLENDIIVPDIKPDISRILLLDGDITVNDTRVDDNKAVIDGTINCRILYLTDDERNIKSINTSSGFSYEQDIPNVSPDMNCIAKCNLEHIEYSILNGRKVNVRTIVKVNTKTMVETEPEITQDLVGIDDIQVLRESITLNSYIGYNKENCSINEYMEIPAGKPVIGEILRSDVKISGKDYKITDNKIIAKGELDISTLYVADDETRSIQFMEHQIPFTQLIDLQGITEDSSCDVEYTIESYRVEAAEDSDGELRMINSEVSLGIAVFGQTKRQVELVVDAYCPSLRLDFEKESFKVSDLLSEQRNQIVLKDTIILDEGSPDISEVFNVMCKPVLSSYEISNDKLTLEGILNCDTLYLSSDEESPVCCQSREIPFKQNIDIKGIDPNMKCDMEFEVDHCNYSMVSSNEVEVRLVVGVSVKVTTQTDIPVITNVEQSAADKARAAAQPGIVIYFTQPGDTLWAVAKRYLIPLDDLRTVNNFNDSDVLVPGQQIYIPKKVS